MAEKISLVEKVVSEPIEKDGFIIYEVERKVRAEGGDYETFKWRIYKIKETGRIRNELFLGIKS
jgi:hypothetical protein